MPAPSTDSIQKQSISADVCVVGGGMAGLCAAIAAARRGARTVLLHDRPVLGGNASSEIRMWICGAHGANCKETGILEEIQLENLRRNPSASYAIWDSVLYEKAFFQPNLTTLLNTTCLDAVVEEERILAVHAWQLTSQLRITIEARYFIDCSGDSILAPLSGALVRQGREAREEFEESIAPRRADLKTMGNSLLLQLRETDTSQPYIPPQWAYRFEESSQLPSRLGNGYGANFWWLELGGLRDTIGEAESIRDDLLRTAHGVWDFMKNRWKEREKMENWALDFLGSLPGKRENRRYEGDYLLTQHDVEAAGPFDDRIAYGGWTMDDHHPAGLCYPGAATLFHPAPSPYGIPYRCLYSKNVKNLFCAGRNISATHAALSSTRVMATCAILGQAAGTAAGLCVREGIGPAALYPTRIAELQQWLMEDDCWLPGLRRGIDRLAQESRLSGAGTMSGALLNGHDRPIGEELNGCDLPLNEPVVFEWDRPVRIGALRIVADSHLADKKRMPCVWKKEGYQWQPPASLLRRFRVEAVLSGGERETIAQVKENAQRLCEVRLEREVRALHFIPEATWDASASHARLFALEPIRDFRAWQPEIKPVSWREYCAELSSEDLAAPDSGLEGQVRGSSRVGA